MCLNWAAYSLMNRVTYSSSCDGYYSAVFIEGGSDPIKRIESWWISKLPFENCSHFPRTHTKGSLAQSKLRSSVLNSLYIWRLQLNLVLLVCCITQGGVQEVIQDVPSHENICLHSEACAVLMYMWIVWGFLWVEACPDCVLWKD